MKTRTHKEQMPARSGRRRGGSEERRGRRPHPSPSRAERNDRPTQRVVEELGCFTRRPHGHDSSESDAERTIPPPKRPKVQDSLSSAPTSAHSTGTTTSASHPTSSNTQSRESDNEDRQSQASRSSAGGSLANSSSSISSGRDIDQDNRSSSPSLSGSPLASLESESDSPDSPKQGGKAKDGPVAKSGVAPRADDGGSAECRDSEGGVEANLSPLKSPSSLGPLTDGGSARKFFSNDSKMVTKMEFPGPACDEVLHNRLGVNPKMASQCSGKPTVGGAVEYAHGNPNVSHSPSAALPPPPALKPLEAGQGAPSDIKVEKVEKCEKPQASHLPQSASLPQQAPPSRHPHHYSPNTWSGTSVSSHGSWSYSRYPGVHHAPVQQQQLPSVYNPPSSTRHPNHPPYLPHSHSTHTQQPNTQRDYVPRYSGPAERERPGRDFGIKDASANAGATGSTTSANPGSDFGTTVPGQTRDFAPPTRDGPSVGREFRPVFRERDAARDFSLQNLNQQHVPQNREFGSGGTSGATGCHTRDKDDRWGDFSGQIRNAGGNNNQSSTGLPASSSQNNSATQNKDFQSSVEPVGPQGPPSQVPSAGSDPPSAGHFLRDYPPQAVKEYPPASVQPAAPHSGPTRDYPSPTGPAGLPPNVGRDFAGGPSVPPGHYMVQPGLSVQSREREREQERENMASSSLYPNRSHPPSLSPSTSSSGHGHQPVPSYPPTSHSQQAPPPSTLPANQARPAQYPLTNQSPSTPLSPLPSPSKNQMGGFPPFSSTSAPASGVATSCISGCRPAPYHGTLNSHAPYPSGYHSSSTHSNTATASNTNSNSGATSNVQLHSPPPSKIQPHLCSPVAQQPVGLTGAEGQGDPMPCPVPPPVIKEEPIEEREETDSPSTVLRSPSPEPKTIDIPIHASQSARFHRVLDRGSANSCARTDVLFIPLDGSKLWKKRNEAMERARREVEQRARDLREKERERERERDRERERERDLERHLQQKESNSAAVPRQGSSLFFPPSSSILLDPSSSSSTPCINPSHQATHHPAHLPHPSHAHSLHPSLAHSIPHSLLLPSVGGLGPYLGPDTPALRTLSEYARPHAMSPLGAPNRAPPHFHPHPHPHPHAHPHMHPSLFLPQFQNPALAHPHHLPADAATAAAILGFLYGSGLEGGHGHPVAGPVAGPGPGGMAGLGASLGGVGFPHAVAAHRERVKSGFDFKSEFDSHTHSHSHSLLLGGGGGAPPSDVAIYGTPPPSAPPPPALVAAVAARNPSAVPQPLSTPPASALLPPTLPAHAPPSVNPTAPAPPPPPPAPPPPPPMVSSLHQPSPAPEGYSTPIRTPPSTERARSVERERERERERVLPGAERERTAPAGGGAVSGGGAASGGGGTSGGGGGGGGGGLQMLNVTPHHHQHSHIHSHLHLHQQDTAASGVHPLIDPLTTGAPLPRLPYPGSIITHPLTESDVLRQQLFGGPFRDLPPHSSMHHQNTELQIQRLALEQQWIHHHTHSLTQEEYYSHLKKESDKTL